MDADHFAGVGHDRDFGTLGDTLRHFLVRVGRTACQWKEWIVYALNEVSWVTDRVIGLAALRTGRNGPSDACEVWNYEH
jgi:hypothetical protein